MKSIRNFGVIGLLVLIGSGTTNCTKLSSTKPGASSSNASSEIPGPIKYPKFGDYPIIPSNFDINQWINFRAYQTPYFWGDGVGAFRFICNASHVAADDPIVYPGKSGASHLHTFFGNTLANASSTYESLRTTGDSTCQGGPINRSAYWIPSTLNGKGQIVMPDYVSVYYKGVPKHRAVLYDPNVLHDPPWPTDYYLTDKDRFGATLTGSQPMPRGLRFIFGYNMSKPEPWHAGSHYWWNCDGPGAVGGHYPNIAAVIAAGCPLGTRIGVVLAAPTCWDGVNLDTPDHRSHLSFMTDPDHDGIGTCPPTHPVHIPHFQLGVWFTHEGPDDLKNWYLSSDRMPGMVHEPGSTAHSDWFGAWDDDIMDTWVQKAINDFRNSSGGDLTDGRGLKLPTNFSWNANPRLVPIPK